MVAMTAFSDGTSRAALGPDVAARGCRKMFWNRARKNRLRTATTSSRTNATATVKLER
jgi:hypothetical protein